jgi:ubiquinone/menaquinone biosynthesis C-methylase UbiE
MDNNNDGGTMLKKFFLNTRKPEGKGGAVMLWFMNWGHGKMAKWGLQYLTVKDNDHILDVGCGGGANIVRMLKMASGVRVFGIDYSSLSVAKAIRYNRAAIARKQCEIKTGSVSHISYSDATFDTVTAFETVYFWPDIKNDVKEVFRVLKPGGTFFICNEAVRLDNGKSSNEYFEKMLDLKIYSPKEFNDILTANGFVDVKINLSKDKKLVCVMGKKRK